MQDTTPIRILEKDANRRGDLFGRLMADLFVALGYEQPRLNVQKPGRELDLSADHRLEPRRAFGECKATSDTIGGDDLNKFVGTLDVEQEDKHPITGLLHLTCRLQGNSHRTGEAATYKNHYTYWIAGH
jgi:hypothetical protein